MFLGFVLTAARNFEISKAVPKTIFVLISIIINLKCTSFYTFFLISMQYEMIRKLFSFIKCLE